MFTADEKNVRNCTHWRLQCNNCPIFHLSNTDTNTVTDMNLGKDVDTGEVTETGMATSMASEKTTDTDMAMNTGMTTNTDSDLVMNTEAHIDTDMDIDMVMHRQRQSHRKPASGHTGSDTFKYNGRGPGHGCRHEYWM